MSVVDYVYRLLRNEQDVTDKFVKIDEFSSTFAFLGVALDGSLTSAAVWKVARIYRQGNAYTIEYAFGGNYDQVWDDRQTLFPNVALTNSYAVNFDGVNDYVNLGTTTLTSMDIGQAWSMSFWIKLNNYASQRTIYGKATGDPYGFFFYVNTSGLLVAHARTATYGYARTGSTVFPLNVWKHVTVVYSGSGNISGFDMYIDGVLESASGTGVLTTSFHAGQTASIGARGGLATFFSGSIDESSFWFKKLTSAEILEIYNSGQPADLNDHSAFADLLHWWRMGDSDTYPIILDNVASVNGTMTNQTSVDIIADVP
jgi:hypothetical protein